MIESKVPARPTDSRKMFLRIHELCHSRRSCRFLPRKYVSVYGQAAQPYSRLSKQCIAERGGRGRGSGFANAARGFSALDDMHFDLRHFIDSQHAVIVKITLLHAALLDADVAVQSRGQSEYHATLQLRDHSIRIYHDPGIHCHDDSLQAHRAVLVPLRLRNRCDETAERHLDPDAASCTSRQGSAPSGLFSRKI